MEDLYFGLLDENKQELDGYARIISSEQSKLGKGMRLKFREMADWDKAEYLAVFETDNSSKYLIARKLLDCMPFSKKENFVILINLGELFQEEKAKNGVNLVLDIIGNDARLNTKSATKADAKKLVERHSETISVMETKQYKGKQFFGLLNEKGQELKGDGYKRATFEFDQYKSKLEIPFPEAENDWETFHYVAHYKTESGGEIIEFKKLKEPLKILSGQNFYYRIDLPFHKLFE